MSPEQIAPCPFCDEPEDIDFVRTSTIHGQMECGSCGARGPSSQSGTDENGERRDEAIAAWNRRSPTPEHGGREGFVLVPREPTEAMLHAGWLDTGESYEMQSRTEHRLANYYRAMLSAAPGLPALLQGGGGEAQ